jgi:hypothetical protein
MKKIELEKSDWVEVVERILQRKLKKRILKGLGLHWLVQVPVELLTQ